MRSLLEYTEDAEPDHPPQDPRHARLPVAGRGLGLVAIALIGSGVIARSYDAHPGAMLWVVAKACLPGQVALRRGRHGL